MKRKIILASRSANRIKLLRTAGIEFTIEKSNYEEDMTEDLPASELCRKLALGKAMDVASKHKDQNAVVIGADTFGIIDGKLIGKPSGAEEARQVLKLISGRKHELITGFAIVDCKSGKTATGFDIAQVWIKNFSEKEIDKYIRTGEPLDKAPSYTIEGIGSVFVEKINGNSSTVIGLPIHKLYEKLPAFGIDLLDYHRPTPS
ncbi:MAG: nucleoside triphosphate pyrophosphatase [Minisyncoccia bacterium]